jgi:hypothetical protein
VVTPPFTLPLIGGAFSPVTDIDWSPVTNTLWICTAAGNVGNLLRNGSLLSSFSAVPGPCGLVPPLLGLALDTATAGAGALYLTDGHKIAKVSTSGATVPATFGQPFGCFTVPSPNGAAYGLGFTSRGIYYGKGGPLIPTPELGTFGQRSSPRRASASRSRARRQATSRSCPSRSIRSARRSCSPPCRS